MELGVCSYCKVPFKSFSEIYTSQPGNVKKHKHCGPTYPVAKFPETVLRSEVDIQVAAETDRCAGIVQAHLTTFRCGKNCNRPHVKGTALNDKLQQIISEIRGAN